MLACIILCMSSVSVHDIMCVHYVHLRDSEREREGEGARLLAISYSYIFHVDESIEGALASREPSPGSGDVEGE